VYNGISGVNLEGIINLEDGYELHLLPRVFRFIMYTTEVRVPGQDGEETVSSGPEYAEFDERVEFSFTLLGLRGGRGKSTPLLCPWEH